MCFVVGRLILWRAPDGACLHPEKLDHRERTSLDSRLLASRMTFPIGTLEQRTPQIKFSIESQSVGSINWPYGVENIGVRTGAWHFSHATMATRLAISSALP
jgi:hypothetical protein